MFPTYIIYFLILFLVAFFLSRFLERFGIAKELSVLLFGLLMVTLDIFSLKTIFPDYFLKALASLVLVMYVFQAVSRVKIKKVETKHPEALRFILLNLFMNVAFFLLLMEILFNFRSLWFSAFFGILLTFFDISPNLSNLMQNNLKPRLSKHMFFESKVNKPVLLLIIFIFIDLYKNTLFVFSGTFLEVISSLWPFFKSVVIGISVGVVMGIVVFKVFRRFKHYSLTLHLMIYALAVLSFFLADLLDASGPLAVLSFGIFLGNVYFKQKDDFFEDSDFVVHVTEILSLLMVWFIVDFPGSYVFVLNTLVIFLVFVFLRLLIVLIFFRKKKLGWKDRLLLGFLPIKGSTETVLMFYSIYLFVGLSFINNLFVTLLMVMLYHNFLSTILRFCFVGRKKIR